MKLIVMDRSGDTRHTFDVASPAGITEAEKKFNEIMGLGHMAVAVGETNRQIKAFDPTIETVVFYPQLIGG